MKNKKGLSALILTFGMLLSVAGCGSTGAPAAASPAADPASQGGAAPAKITFVYMTGNNIPEAAALQSVEDAINTYTREKINTEVKLVMYSNKDYQTQLNLMLASGEQADIFRAHTVPTLNFIKDGTALDITAYLDTVLKETKDILYPNMLKLTTVDKKVYGINTMGSNYVPTGWTYRTDIVKELGIDLSSVKTFADLTPIFAKVKEAYPNMILIDSTRANMIFEGYLGSTRHIDALSDGISTPKGGVVREGETKIQNLYEMEEFEEIASLTREWYQKGYFAKDAATTTATAAELLMSGNCFSIFVGLGNPKIASQYSANYGYSFDNIPVSGAWLQNLDKEAWMINAKCREHEAAAKFMNLLYTDQYLDNLLIYGLEGRDYKLDADKYVIPPDGFKDLNSVPYTCNMNYYMWGNKWLAYTVAGGLDYETAKASRKQNYEAPMSAYYGFLFDYGDVEAEYTAVKNVIEEYKKAFWVGSLDVGPALEEMNKKLYASGLQKIIDAKQAQFDTWLSQQ